MTSNPLAAMIAKQKAQANANDVPKTHPANGSPTAEAGTARPDPNPAVTESVEAPKAPAQHAAAAGFASLAAAFGKPAPRPASPPATDPGTDRLSDGSGASPTGDADGPKQPAPLAAGLSGLKLSSSTDSRPVGGVPLSLDDVFASEDAGVVDTGETHAITFDDLVDCKVPDRELPEDITADAKMFVEQLNQVYSTLYDAQLFGQQIRFVMQELQEHREYAKLVAPMDVHVMIRGMREVMQSAQLKKEEKTPRKSAGSSDRKGRATKSGALDALLDSTLGGMDFE